MANNKIILNPAVVARTLGVIAFVLVVAGVGGQLAKYLWGHPRLFGLVRLFDVNNEQNIPAIFSAFLLLFAASLLAVITIFKNRQRDIDVSKWAVLSLGFLFMAVDEATSIHENLTGPMRGLLGLSEGGLGFFYFTWVIAGIAIALVLGLYFLGFLLRLPEKTRFFFIDAATLFLSGAIGLELIGGRYFELHGLNLTYNMITTVEETLEMAGRAQKPSATFLGENVAWKKSTSS